MSLMSRPRAHPGTERPTVRRSGARPGIALLETIVALTIFTIAALSAAMRVRQMDDAVRRADDAAAATAEASRYLDRLSLWPTADLDRHLGTRSAGVWVVTVSRPTRTLYEISVATSTGAHVLVHTMVYRPVADSTHA